MKKLTIIGLAVAVVTLGGCAMRGRMWTNVENAVAIMHPTEGNTANGTVHFVQQTDGVLIVVDIKGLEPNSVHGIHAHEYGDCTALDATSAGGHYNPQGYPHRLPPAQPRHAGDFGNITADANGRARAYIKVDNVTVAGMHNPLVGRAVILHAQPDSGMGATGEAGARIACGVIGIGNPAFKP